MARKTKLWRYQAGRRPHTVTVLELDAGGPIYLSVYLKREGRIAYRSLKHRDKKQAIDQAERLAAKRREGAEAVATGTVTLERVFRLYRAHQTPKKAPSTQVEDERPDRALHERVGQGQEPLCRQPRAVGHAHHCSQDGGHRFTRTRREAGASGARA